MPVWLAAAGIPLACGAAYFLLLRPFPGLPSFPQVRAAHVQSEAVLMDRNGRLLHEIRIDAQGRRLQWTALPDVSPAMRAAAVAAEDHRFYRHAGVDWISLGGAVRLGLSSSRPRGASTISMQLAGMLRPEVRPPGVRPTLSQKCAQIRAARTLEKSWSKEEILEAYLNLVAFRGELRGIAAAARGLFAKEPQGLNDVEAAILAVLVRSPNAGIEAVRGRACALAKKMEASADCAAIDAAAGGGLSGPYSVQPAAAYAPHVARRLLGTLTDRADGRPRRVACTLELGLQVFASDVLRHHVLSAGSRNMHDGSVLVADNASGDILAYVGNIGDRSSARFVDGVPALRQAGSTLKPFVYALAFDRRILTPASLIDDSPLEIPVPGGVYRPKNYDNLFQGMVTARTALASSLNVPAVKALNLVGIGPFVGIMKRLDFRGIREPEYYGLSIALGSADITLWDLVAAYRALANGGVWTPLRIAPGEERKPPRRVVSEEAAFLVADILSDRESRSLTFSLESPLATRYWTAVKTGTSKDMRDNWCVGFSDRYTVGVWAGNFSGEPMWNVSGVTGAAPVWVEIMNRLHRGETSRGPAPPAGVVRAGVTFEAAAETRQEWFLRGTQTDRIRPAGSTLFPEIAYPTDGMIVALDPDIPPGDQKLFFEARPEAARLEWILDGERLDAGSALVPWTPRKGKHALRLLDAERRELDSVHFEVRGDDGVIRDSRSGMRDPE